MADVILSVDVQSDADGFNDIQRELREVGGNSERTFQSIEQRSNDARREQIRLREEITRLGGQISSNNRIAHSCASRSAVRELASPQSNRQIQSRAINFYVHSNSEIQTSWRGYHRKTEN